MTKRNSQAESIVAGITLFRFSNNALYDLAARAEELMNYFEQAVGGKNTGQVIEAIEKLSNYQKTLVDQLSQAVELLKKESDQSPQCH